MLFTSKAFKEGKSELVFFITPEIVDARNNNQIDNLMNKTNFTNDLEVNKKEKELQEEQKNKKIEEVIEEEKQKKEEVTEKAEEQDSRAEHEKRVKEILGY